MTKSKLKRAWANGKYLPPRKKGYTAYEYVSEVRNHATKAVEAYKESIGRRY